MQAQHPLFGLDADPPPCAVNVSAAQGTRDMRTRLTVNRRPTTIGVATQAIVSAFEEAYDVECDRQPPVDREPALALRSRRLRLA